MPSPVVSKGVTFEGSSTGTNTQEDDYFTIPVTHKKGTCPNPLAKTLCSTRVKNKDVYPLPINHIFTPESGTTRQNFKNDLFGSDDAKTQGKLCMNALPSLILQTKTSFFIRLTIQEESSSHEILSLVFVHRIPR